MIGSFCTTSPVARSVFARLYTQTWKQLGKSTQFGDSSPARVHFGVSSSTRCICAMHKTTPCQCMLDKVLTIKQHAIHDAIAWLTIDDRPCIIMH